MRRRSVILVALAVLLTMPLTAMAADVLDFCESHDSALRMSDQAGCADHPCCLSPATPAAARDTGRLTKPAAATKPQATTDWRRPGALSPPLPDPPHVDLSGLQARLTTVLRC